MSRPPLPRAVWLALLLVALLATIRWNQDRLLYHPTRLDPQAAFAEARRNNLSPWPSATEMRGWRREPDHRVAAANSPTLLLFHGNAGHAAQRDAYADYLAPLGWRVILAEYPGYGARPGTLDEASLVADGVAALRLARTEYAGPLILAGESLGAGVASAVAHAAATQGLRIDGLLLITPWDTLAQVARHHYPWLPVTWLLRDRYDSVENLRMIGTTNGPRIAIVVAEQDRVIPAQLGLRLHAEAPTGTLLLRIAKGDHNDWSDYTDPAWWRTLADFLNPGSTPIRRDAK